MVGHAPRVGRDRISIADCLGILVRAGAWWDDDTSVASRDACGQPAFAQGSGQLVDARNGAGLRRGEPQVRRRFDYDQPAHKWGHRSGCSIGDRREEPRSEVIALSPPSSFSALRGNSITPTSVTNSVTASLPMMRLLSSSIVVV